MASAPPTDKAGRCYGKVANSGDEDIKSLLREGVTGVSGDTASGTNAAGFNSEPRGTSFDNNNDTAGGTDSASRDRALRVLRNDLENSRGLERQGSHIASLERDRPGRPEPYKTAKRMRQIGKNRSFDETNLTGSEAITSGGPSTPLSGDCLSNSSRHGSLSELNPSEEPVRPVVFSDEDTEDRSYGDSSTTSSSFWSTPRYGRSNVPNILVSGANEVPEINHVSDVITDNKLAADMDKEYTGSAVVHHPHYAGELISLLNIMRESGELVNTKIHSGGLTFSGYKALFAAGSPYLATAMDIHSKSALKKVELEITDVRADVVGQLVNFIYSGRIGISSHNAQEMLQQAYNNKLFVGKSVELACSEYLIGQFPTEGGSETSSTTGLASSVFSLEDDGQSSSLESVFNDRNYPLDILYALNTQRHEKQFTDLVLTVEGREFHCHRAILIAISPYFRAMLTSDMKESVEEEVTLHDIRADIFSRLLDFVYTCRLYLNDDNAQDIMELACFLQLLPAISACAQYLKDQLATYNCLGILSFAHMYSCSQLYCEAMDFALTHFTDVTSSEEFQDLQPTILSALIADDNLNVKKEESVYDAVMVWLRYDIDKRLPQLPSVLTHVRLPLIDPEYFVLIVESEPLLKQSPECDEIVQAAKDLRQSSGKTKQLTDVRLKLRFSMKTQVMVIVGGYDDEQLWIRDVLCFSPKTATWLTLAPFPGRNRRFGCIALGNDIYVIGGQADHGDHMSETLSDAWRYDSITDTWSQIASMNKPRHAHGLAVVNGKIYAVGGKMGWAKRFNDVERYDPSANLWTYETRIKGSYVEKPCCTSYDNKLYVNGYFFRDPDIMHCYNPTDGSWEAMYSFKRRDGDGIENAVVLHDYIYFTVYRGYDNFVIVYSPSTGDHIRGRVMPNGKYLYSYGMTVIGDKIYVAGGSKLDASINVPYIQCYDPALDLWGVVGAIPYPLCEHGCVTIEKYMPLVE